MLGRINLLRDWTVTTEGSPAPAFTRLHVNHPITADGDGWYPIGFEKGNHHCFDSMGWYGLEIEFESNHPVSELNIRAHFINHSSIEANVKSSAKGRSTLYVSLLDFEIEKSKANVWRFLTGFTFTSHASLLSISLLRAKEIFVHSSCKGKAGDVNEEITYTVTLLNCTEQEQFVSIKQQFDGWESLIATISPSEVQLKPAQAIDIKVQFTMHQDIVPGGHEYTTLSFTANGSSNHTTVLQLITSRRLPHPYIYWNKEQWKHRKELIDKHECFQPGYQQIINDADHWVVKPPLSIDERDYCYDTAEEHYMMSAAYAYALTGEQRYAEKVAQFFRYFTDPLNGYPNKLKGCSQSYVQEGHFFQHLAIPYDIIYEANVLSADEHQAIEHCFRLYMDILDVHIQSGHISNWLLSEITGAVYCAMALQDMDRVFRFVYGAGGTIEQMKYGLFNDGWWYECTVSYNTWVASMCLHTAHALLPFGINIIHAHFPVPYNKQVDSTYKAQPPHIRFGMVNERWGGNQKNYICIKDMFDAAIPFLDYRGVIFGINDSYERKLEGVHFGSTYDLAYHYYKDEQYVPIIKQQQYVDPIFGHAELPDVVSSSIANNAYSDNIGIAMLRSQKKGRAQAEQIQAVLRYGSHGYAHGHFDRTELLSIMRYGRSFYNPEHVWWGYLHFMYKFYVQNSMTKNMVVVDNKLQVPADSRRTLFYSGEMVQAAAVETTAAWAYPPYGGMIYQEGETLEQRAALNASCLPGSPPDAAYGQLSHHSEPIYQKRVMAVTDDYIVMFDYVSGTEEHQFDSLLQIKGFQQLTADSLEKVKQTSQWTTNPLSDGQFITDCHWFTVKGQSLAQFETVFGDGEDLRGTRSFYNTPGSLKLNVHTAWPLQSEQIIGRAAEDHSMMIPMSYRVEADIEENAKVLASGRLDAWLLGEGRVEIELTPTMRSLALIVNNHPLYNEQKYPYRSKQGLFWGAAYLETRDGKQIPIHELPLAFQNVDHGYGIGKDYENGRVTIVGNEYPYAIPTSPIDHAREAIITVPLAEELHAVKFVGLIGADAFPGDEAQRRITYGVRTKGKLARYITIIEPFEHEAMISSIQPVSENKVIVQLRDGRLQEIEVEHIDSQHNQLTLSEYSNELLIRKETTQQ